MRLGAAGGEGAGHAEHDELAAAGELRQVDLLVGGALEEVDGGDGVSRLDRSHAGRVEESVGDDGGESGDAAGDEARERLHCSLRRRR